MAHVSDNGTKSELDNCNGQKRDETTKNGIIGSANTGTVHSVMVSPDEDDFATKNIKMANDSSKELADIKTENKLCSSVKVSSETEIKNIGTVIECKETEKIATPPVAVKAIKVVINSKDLILKLLEILRSDVTNREYTDPTVTSRIELLQSKLADGVCELTQEFVAELEAKLEKFGKTAAKFYLAPRRSPGRPKTTALTAVIKKGQMPTYHR